MGETRTCSSREHSIRLSQITSQRYLLNESQQLTMRDALAKQIRVYKCRCPQRCARDVDPIGIKPQAFAVRVQRVREKASIRNIMDWKWSLRVARGCYKKLNPTLPSRGLAVYTVLNCLSSEASLIPCHI